MAPPERDPGRGREHLEALPREARAEGGFEHEVGLLEVQLRGRVVFTLADQSIVSADLEHVLRG